GRAQPLLGTPGRLHVVVAVEQDGGRAGLVQPVAVDVGMDARDLEDLDVLDPYAAHRVRDRVGGAADLGRGKALGGNAGYPREVDQGLLKVVEVPLEVVEGPLHGAVRVGHPASFASFWQSTIAGVSYARPPSSSCRRAAGRGPRRRAR